MGQGVVGATHTTSSTARQLVLGVRLAHRDVGEPRRRRAVSGEDAALPFRLSLRAGVRVQADGHRRFGSVS